MQTGVMNKLRWMRVPGDSLFALGALILGWFVLGLVTGHSFDRTARVPVGGWQLKEKLSEEEERELIRD
jgi:nitric oxide reductase subunit B